MITFLVVAWVLTAGIHMWFGIVDIIQAYKHGNTDTELEQVRNWRNSAVL